MKRVKIAELKDNLSRYLRAVEKGEEVEVTDRGRPIARIVPIGGLKIVPATKRFATIRNRRYSHVKMRASTLDLLLEDRGKR